jgi:hypothetical protein
VAAPGESKTFYLFTTARGGASGGGDRKPPDASVSIGSQTGAVPDNQVVTSPPFSVEYDYLWQLDVCPISVALDVVTLNLDWRRTDLKNGARQTSGGDHRTLTLRQGERHLLDFVSCSPDAPCVNQFLELHAVPVENSAAADTVLSYDIWLVHQTAEGGKVTRHSLASGRQGEKVPFAFVAVPLQLDAAATPDAASPYRLQVSGTIAARLKPDGTIDVALSSTRNEQSPMGALGRGEGVKSYTCRPDETTSISLPAIPGSTRWRADAGLKLRSPGRGVTVSGDAVVIDLNQFFENTNTAILLTVHKEG